MADKFPPVDPRPVLRTADGKLAKGTKRLNTKSTTSRVELLASHIARKTQNGLEIANELISISTDKRFRPNERIRAMEILLDRLLGKAIDVPAMLAVAANGTDKRVHSNLSDAVLEQLIRTLPAPTSTDTIDGQVTEPVGAQPATEDEKPE